MAKWEDKDPKWIVQDRQDGSNVNGVISIPCSLTGRPPQSRPLHELLIGHPAGWHWEEKNQLGWSKQKLEELLVGLLVDMSAVQGNAKVTALKDLKGEVRLGPAFVLVMHGTAYHTQYTYCNTVRFLAEPPRPHAEVLCMKDYHASGLAACPFTCRVLALHSKQHELWHLHSRCGLSDECITMWGLQALLTTRKGKKRFAMYDLTVTLTWQGLWVEDDKKQV